MLPNKIRFWDTAIRLRSVKLTLAEGGEIKWQQYDKELNELVTVRWTWPIGNLYVYKFTYCDGGLDNEPYHEQFVDRAQVEQKDGKYLRFGLPVSHRFPWPEVDWDCL